MTAAPVSLRWRRGIWLTFGLILCIPLMIRLMDLANWPQLGAPLHPFNPDVWMRLAEVRQWITDGFFNHAVSGTNAPIGGIESHWTRPLDFILAALYSVTPAKDTTELRLMLAAAWYPVLLSLAAAGLMTATAYRIFRHNHVLACTLLLFLCSPYMADYFKPGDADHHGLMSVLWCAVLALLAGGALQTRQAVATGILLGLITWISPEGMLIYAATLGVLGFDALLAGREDRHRLSAPAIAAVATALTVTTGLFVEIPADKIFTHITYDSLSLVHVVVFWVAAVAAAAIALCWRHIERRSVRIFTALAVCCAGGLAIYVAYPKFFMGPMADAHPYVFTDFLPAVSEARPLMATSFSSYFPTLLQPLLAGLLLLSVLLRRRRLQRRQPLIILGTLMAVMLVLTLVQTRWNYYLAPVSVILCAGLLPSVSIATRRFSFAPRRWQPYLWMAMIAAYIMGSLAATMKTQVAGNAAGTGCMSEARYVIQTQQLQKLLGDKSDIFYTYEDVGGEMLFFTPYRIIASNYHREADGLRDLKHMRGAADIDSFHALLKKRKVDTLLVCPVYHPRFFKQGEALPAWLQPVDGMKFYKPDGNMPLLLRVMP